MHRTPRGGEPWSPAELARLQRAYRRGGYRAAIQALPHRTRAAVASQARKWNYASRATWTARDLALALRMAATGDTAAAIAHALGRSTRAVQNKLGRIGVRTAPSTLARAPTAPPRERRSNAGTRVPAARRWSRAEDARLAARYGACRLAELVHEFPGRSRAALAIRGSERGLTRRRQLDCIGVAPRA